MKYEPLEIQWIKHVGAENNERGSDPKDIIENVSFSAAEGIRGDLTGKEYDAPKAIAMTAKYDKLAAAGYFRKDPHINKLSATDAVIAAKTGKDAAAYHKQDPKLIKKFNELRVKRNRILNDIKKEKKRGDDLKKAHGLKLTELPIVKNNINNTKPKRRDFFKHLVKTGELLTPTKEESDNLRADRKVREYILRGDKPKKVASAPNKPEEANGHDEYPNVVPIGPIPHEKPWWQTYKFQFPKQEKYSILDKIKLQTDLEKATDAVSGIGQFNKRIRLAGGSNGSTSEWDEDHPFTKRVQDIYGIQLTGQETFGELLEIIKKLNKE